MNAMKIYNATCEVNSISRTLAHLRQDYLTHGDALATVTQSIKVKDLVAQMNSIDAQVDIEIDNLSSALKLLTSLEVLEPGECLRPTSPEVSPGKLTGNTPHDLFSF